MEDKQKKLELIQHILGQAVEISTSSIIDVFVNYASHTQQIDVTVYKKGWDADTDFDYKKTVYLEGLYDSETSLKKLNDIKNYLEEIRKEVIK